MSEIRKVETDKLNRRITNGTYGGVRGKSIHCLMKSFLYSSDFV